MGEAEALVVIYGILSVLWQSLYVIDQNSWMRKTLQDISLCSFKDAVRMVER